MIPNSLILRFDSGLVGKRGREGKREGRRERDCAAAAAVDGSPLSPSLSLSFVGVELRKGERERERERKRRSSRFLSLSVLVRRRRRPRTERNKEELCQILTDSD